MLLKYFFKAINFENITVKNIITSTVNRTLSGLAHQRDNNGMIKTKTFSPVVWLQWHIWLYFICSTSSTRIFSWFCWKFSDFAQWTVWVADKWTELFDVFRNKKKSCHLMLILNHIQHCYSTSIIICYTVNGYHTKTAEFITKVRL